MPDFRRAVESIWRYYDDPAVRFMWGNVVYFLLLEAAVFQGEEVWDGYGEEGARDWAERDGGV